jgi:24-hydroxycholesterol 7alpha-hydroxylase
MTYYPQDDFKLIPILFFLCRNWSKSKRGLLALFAKNIPDIKAYKSAKDNSVASILYLLFVTYM